MSIYVPPSITHFEPIWSPFSFWRDHSPFGYDIVEATRPKLLVELGTYRGVSYFTFCQSVKDHDSDTLCYAVDTWQGDAHANLTDRYDGSVFEQVTDHNRKYYNSFSYLLRMRFNEALSSFGESTIDLLHIDGYHTYDAVREDFTSWFAKVKPGGIILFHDITARVTDDFGVWRFWEEYSPQFESFAFYHSYGLGVLRKPGKDKPDAPLHKLLFGEDEGQKEKLRQFYAHAARFFDLKRIAEGKKPSQSDDEKQPETQPDPQEDAAPMNGARTNRMTGGDTRWIKHKMLAVYMKLRKIWESP